MLWRLVSKNPAYLFISYKFKLHYNIFAIKILTLLIVQYKSLFYSKDLNVFKSLYSWLKVEKFSSRVEILWSTTHRKLNHSLYLVLNSR